MNRSTIHKLLLARRHFELSKEHLDSENELSLGVGVNLLQDSVELFLQAVSEHVDAGVLSTTHFDKYFQLIDTKIAPKELPFRSRLFALNKLRVNSKHYGLAPAKSETEGLVVTVREFFDEVSDTILNNKFASISLVQLLRDGEVKNLLLEAEECFKSNNYEDCLINCRKAVYSRFESSYDISPYKDEQNPQGIGLLLLMRKAPVYARNREYIEKNVKDPTDFIVMDHNEIEIELMKYGIDSVAFWNIWRLTPEVWRADPNSDWVVKREFRKLEEDGLADRAEYVLDASISLFLAADKRVSATKSPDYRSYYITLKEPGAPIYEKADLSSKIIGYTPADKTKFFVDFSVDALNGEGIFWHIAHFENNPSLYGYIPADLID